MWRASSGDGAWERWLMSRESESLMDEVLVLDCQSGSLGALETLVERWQKRLWRHAYYVEGFGIAEVAVTLGIPEGTVKSRLHTARAAFKDLWQPAGELD